MLRRVCTFAGHAHDRMLVGIELGDVHKRVKSPLITSSTGALPLGLGSLARGRPTKIKVESTSEVESRVRAVRKQPFVRVRVATMIGTRRPHIAYKDANPVGRGVGQSSAQPVSHI
eukprot:6216267-Prymnesium_polylepis.1